MIGAEPGEGLVGKEFQRGAGGQIRQVLVCHCATVRTLSFTQSGLRSQWKVKKNANDSLLVPTTYLVLRSLFCIHRQLCSEQSYKYIFSFQLYQGGKCNF